MRFVFDIKLPSQNEIINMSMGQKRRYSPYGHAKGPIEKLLVAQIKEQLREQKCEGFKIEEKVFFLFTWTSSNKRTDPDNRMAGQKFVFDALVKAGLMKTDGHKYALGIYHHLKYGNVDKVDVLVGERQKVMSAVDRESQKIEEAATW